MSLPLQLNALQFAQLQPVFEEEDAVVFFERLVVFNEYRTGARPIDEDDLRNIQAYHRLSKRQWSCSSRVFQDPVAEGRRIGILLIEHASRIVVDRGFFIYHWIPLLLTIGPADQFVFTADQPFITDDYVFVCLKNARATFVALAYDADGTRIYISDWEDSNEEGSSEEDSSEAVSDEADSGRDISSREAGPAV